MDGSAMSVESRRNDGAVIGADQPIQPARQSTPKLIMAAVESISATDGIKSTVNGFQQF